MKVKYFLMLVIASLCLVSCGEDKHTKQERIIYSDNIQDTFFGVKFGASKKEVIEALKKYNLYSISNVKDSVLYFYPKNRSEFFDFGGFNWNSVNAHFSCDKFYEISFHYSDNEAATMRRLLKLYNEVSQKYHMINETTEEFKRYVAISKDGKKMEINCPCLPGFGCEDVFLVYSDEKLTYEEINKRKAKAKAEL